MHVIVVNDKDLGFGDSQSEDNRRRSEQMTVSDAPTLVMNSNGDVVDSNKVPVKKKTKKSLAHMIPAFGIIMSIFSVFCFSLASLIVKVLKELHSLEILFIR